LVRHHSGPKRRAFVFVHGYNTRYDEAVFRFAQIVHDSETSGAPILFSWPSRGDPLGYAYDRESANYSRTDLETVLQEAVTKPDVDEVVIMAHSMGGWLTIEALRQMSIRNGGLPGKIRDVILAAPDLDVDVFRRQMQDIHPDHTRCSSPRTTALWVCRACSAAESTASVPSIQARSPTVRPLKKPASP
jgi:esterase/lipase superfamily enzyme